VEADDAVAVDAVVHASVVAVVEVLVEVVLVEVLVLVLAAVAWMVEVLVVRMLVDVGGKEADDEATTTVVVALVGVLALVARAPVVVGMVDDVVTDAVATDEDATANR
jgi:hypothetical protein